MRKFFASDFFMCLCLVLTCLIPVGAFVYTMDTSPPNPHAAPITQPQVIMEVIDPQLMPFAPMWQREIGRRFDNAVGILVHGGDFEQGRWIVKAGLGTSRELEAYHIMTAQALVQYYQKYYPNRTIILVSCNTGHLKLGIPGVYYGTGSVWLIPDRELTPDMFTSDLAHAVLDTDREFEDVGPGKSRWQTDPDAVGNIFEFVCD